MNEYQDCDNCGETFQEMDMSKDLAGEAAWFCPRCASRIKIGRKWDADRRAE